MGKMVEVINLYLSPSYSNLFPGLVLDHGNKEFLYDINQRSYFDLFSNFGVTNLGHCSKVVEAVKKQIDKLMAIMTSDLYNPPAHELASQLNRTIEKNLNFRDIQVYYGNSGAEANEAAIKLAYFKKKGFGISFLNAFHGRTLGILPHSSSKSIHRSPFQLTTPILVPGFGKMSSINYIEDIVFKKIAIPDNISYIITEPIQIEGGVIVPEKNWLRELYLLCNEWGIQLIVDEIQTGFGRTGKMFASEIMPDILTLGKAIASGLPLSATIARDMNWKEGMQGSTFGGNVVACVSGLKTLELIEKLIEQGTVKKLEETISQGLKQLESLDPVDVRGKGAIWAIDFNNWKIMEEIRKALWIKDRILTIPCGESAIRIEPPLNFNLELMDKVLDTLVTRIEEEFKYFENQKREYSNWRSSDLYKFDYSSSRDFLIKGD